MSEAVTQSNPDRLPTPEELGFDPGLLREKYAAERACAPTATANTRRPPGSLRTKTRTLTLSRASHGTRCTKNQMS